MPANATHSTWSSSPVRGRLLTPTIVARTPHLCKAKRCVLMLKTSCYHYVRRLRLVIVPTIKTVSVIRLTSPTRLRAHLNTALTSTSVVPRKFVPSLTPSRSSCPSAHPSAAPSVVTGTSRVKTLRARSWCRLATYLKARRVCVLTPPNTSPTLSMKPVSALFCARRLSMKRARAKLLKWARPPTNSRQWAKSSARPLLH